MIEDVIHAPIDLESLVDLIRRVDIEDGIRRQFRRLVGAVTDKVLTADK